MRLHPHRTTELECLKGTTTTEVNSVPFCQCLFLLYKPLLQNSPSIGSSKITVPISTSMPHSTVQRKSAGNRTIKARGTENALEIIRNPGNSSAFLQVIELGEEGLNKNSPEILEIHQFLRFYLVYRIFYIGRKSGTPQSGFHRKYIGPRLRMTDLNKGLCGSLYIKVYFRYEQFSV